MVITMAVMYFMYYDESWNMSEADRAIARVNLRMFFFSFPVTAKLAVGADGGCNPLRSFQQAIDA